LSEEESPPSQEKWRETYHPLSILVIFATVIFIILAIFMGGSSVATEPNPILGDYFPHVVTLIVLIGGIIFTTISSKIRGQENATKTH